MGRIAKLDSALQRGLDNGFAFVFGGKVVPAELEELLKQEIEDNLSRPNGNGILAPNFFEVSVSTKDFVNLSSQHPSLPADFADRMGRFARNKGWSLAGPVVVFVTLDGSIRTGQLKARSTSNPNPGTASGYAGNDVEPPPQQQPHSYGGAAGGNGYQPNPETFLQPAQQPMHQPPMPQPSADSQQFPPEPSSPFQGGSYSSDSYQPEPSARSDGYQPMHQPPMPQSPPPGLPPLRQSPGQQHIQEEPATEIVPAPHLQNFPTVLLVLQDGSNRSYQVQEGSNIIGRGVDADLRLPDTGVSRQHAEVTWDGRDAVLVDLQSTNGTTVNSMPVENWLLADGDVIAVGHSYIEVRISG